MDENDQQKTSKVKINEKNVVVVGKWRDKYHALADNLNKFHALY